MKKKTLISFLCCIAAVSLTIGIIAVLQIGSDPVADPDRDYPLVEESLSRHGFGIVRNTQFRGGTVMIGNPIYVYELMPDGVSVSRYAYPFFSEDQIIAAAIPFSVNEFVAEQHFHSYLQPLVGSSIAVIYDREDCYAFDGKEFHLLYHYGVSHTEDRGSVKDVENISALAETVILNELAPVAPLADYP